MFLFTQLAVQAHLFFQVSIELPATKQHQDPSSEFSQHVHLPSCQQSGVAQTCVFCRSAAFKDSPREKPQTSKSTKPALPTVL